MRTAVLPALAATLSNFPDSSGISLAGLSGGQRAFKDELRRPCIHDADDAVRRHQLEANMSLRKVVVIGLFTALASAAVPSKASADWLFTPFLGATFGGSANIAGGGDAFKDEFERKLNYGASLAWLSGGMAGFEVDFGYSPNFFGVSSNSTRIDFVGDGNVTTLMGNLIFASKTGGVRPYASGGAGLIRSKVDDPQGFFNNVSTSDVGLDAGGGVIVGSSNIGLRGDIRYFRSLKNNDSTGVDLALGDFRFWRGTLGITFKF